MLELTGHGHHHDHDRPSPRIAHDDRSRPRTTTTQAMPAAHPAPARRAGGVMVPFGAAASPDLTILPVFLAATTAGSPARWNRVVIFAAGTFGTIVGLTLAAARRRMIRSRGSGSSAAATSPPRGAGPHRTCSSLPGNHLRDGRVLPPVSLSPPNRPRTSSCPTGSRAARSDGSSRGKPCGGLRKEQSCDQPLRCRTSKCRAPRCSAPRGNRRASALGPQLGVDRDRDPLGVAEPLSCGVRRNRGGVAGPRTTARTPRAAER